MKPQFLFHAIACAYFAASFWGTRFQALSLEITNATRNASGQVEFSVVAGEGTTNTIEFSQTMESWFPLASGVATNGLVPFVHPGSASYDRLFYRVRSGPEIPAQAVSYGVDANMKVFALLSPETGGQCQIFTADGPVFTFSATSNLVREPTIISMTLVTNITPAVSSNAPVAVLLEPAGLEFSGVAQLEILFPTNLPLDFNAGYTFGSDGKELHLVPSTTDSNRVVIHVRHFSGYGTAPITRQMSSDLAEQTLVNAAQTLERNIATRLQENRFRSRSWITPPDNRLFGDLYNMLEEFYRMIVKPAFDRAATDCFLAPAAIGAAAFYLSFFDSTYVTGGVLDRLEFRIPLEPERENEIRTKVCEIINRCDSELDSLCSRGGFSYQGLADRAIFLESARRDFRCSGGHGELLFDRFRNCAADWYGTVTFHAQGGVTNAIPRDNYVEWGELDWYWNGFITNATISINDTNNFMINASLALQTYAMEHSVTFHSYPKDCPSRAGETYIVDKTYIGSTNQAALLSVNVLNGEVLYLQVTSDPTGVLGIPKYGNEWNHKRTLRCDGTESTVSKHTPSKGLDWPANAFGSKPCLQFMGDHIFGTCTYTNVQTVGDVQVEATTAVIVNLKRR